MSFFSVVGLPAFAKKSFGGDLDKAAESLIRIDHNVKYKPARVLFKRQCPKMKPPRHELRDVKTQSVA